MLPGNDRTASTDASLGEDLILPWEFDLAALIDAVEIQSIMDDFHSLTGMVTAILDRNGKVIEATGWQDICTQFHRVHPETSCNCTESDLFLARNLKKGEYLDYKCKNGLVDVVTPLYVGSRHIGNIYTGQFFYEDEVVDEELFGVQASRYGFDRGAYLAAVRKIPRYSRETVANLMSFLVKFATYISGIALSNVELERQNRVRKEAEEEISRLNRELELRVRKRTTELEEANKELEDFVYTISHDLRAPLRSISGFAEIIERRHKDSLNEESRHYFGNIIQASKQMGLLIDDLLGFSRLGRASVKFRPVMLAEIFRAAVDSLAPQIAKTQASIEIPAKLPSVVGDFPLLTNIFVNLLDNALTYCPEHRQPRIEIGVVVQGEYAVVSVSDNGLGIEPQYHQKIFKMFQRLHSDSEYKGTGIGLAAVKKVVQIMRGQVWVESQNGMGSTFKVQLPMVNQS